MNLNRNLVVLFVKRWEVCERIIWMSKGMTKRWVRDLVWKRGIQRRRESVWEGGQRELFLVWEGGMMRKQN